MADLIVWVHVLETRTGEWCPTCLLPSAITIVTAISMKKDKRPLPGAPTMMKTWCADCGWEPGPQWAAECQEFGCQSEEPT